MAGIGWWQGEPTGRHQVWQKTWKWAKKTTAQKTTSNSLAGAGTQGLEHFKELNIRKSCFAFHYKTFGHVTKR